MLNFSFLFPKFIWPRWLLLLWQARGVVKREKIPTRHRYLGAFIGDGVDIGIKVSAMPGVIIGGNVTVGPSTVVMKNIPDNIKYYTKFHEVVIKKK